MARHSAEKGMSIFIFCYRVAASTISIQVATERSDRQYLGRPVARHSAANCMSVYRATCTKLAENVCRSIERHAFSAVFACRSIERHAYSITVARRSRELHAFRRAEKPAGNA